MKIIQLLFLFLTNTIIYSQKIPDSTYFYTYENDRIRDWTRDHYNKIGDTIHITREDFDFDSSKFKNHQLIKEVKSNCKNVRTRERYPYLTPIGKTDRMKKSFIAYAIRKRW